MPVKNCLESSKGRPEFGEGNFVAALRSGFLAADSEVIRDPLIFPGCGSTATVALIDVPNGMLYTVCL